MANENVKIIVQEVDETRPKGSGESSDIVYVPGLCTAFAPGENRNVPILCRSVDDFEEKFGSEPFQFMEDDTIYGVDVHVGDYDKSYIYARELLNAGLNVLYDAICPAEHKLANIADFNISNGTNGVTKVRNSKNAFYVDSDNSTTALSGKDIEFTFNLESCQTVYGGVSVLVESHLSGLEAKLVSITAPNSKFHVGRESNGENSIEWEPLDAVTTDDLAKDFKVVVSIAGIGKGNISVSLVEGLNISSQAEVIERPLKYFYDKIGEHLDVLRDKNEYNVKYITTGGYPSFVSVPQDPKGSSFDYSIATKMLSVAADRNDAVAIIDHPEYKEGDYDLGIGVDGDFYKSVNDYFQTSSNTEFGAMFTPWGNYSCVTMDKAEDSLQAMPASFGYLLCLASAIKTSPNWLAMAGVTRGIVPNLRGLRTKHVLSNVIAENYQPKYGSETNCISINAITNIKPYGLTIWGNRTLKKVDSRGTVATNFLNTRNMISDIKKLSYNTAKSLMFEQDSDALWLRFKSGVSPLLDQLKSGAGISDYKLIKNTTKYNGKALTRGEMAAVIKIFPLYAIEYFEITVVVSDNDVSVS